MMYGDWPECERLSANLSEATKTYFGILAAIQLALDAQNAVLIWELEAPKAAAERRGKARQELRQHEATHHPKAKAQTA
jgi:hypothetical protein